MKQDTAVKKPPLFCCSNRGLSIYSCKYSRIVILYLTDTGTQAEAVGKDLTGALQEKKG